MRRRPPSSAPILGREAHCWATPFWRPAPRRVKSAVLVRFRADAARDADGGAAGAGSSASGVMARRPDKPRNVSCLSRRCTQTGLQVRSRIQISAKQASHCTPSAAIPHRSSSRRHGTVVLAGTSAYRRAVGTVGAARLWYLRDQSLTRKLNSAVANLRNAATYSC